MDGNSVLVGALFGVLLGYWLGIRESRRQLRMARLAQIAASEQTLGFMDRELELMHREDGNGS